MYVRITPIRYSCEYCDNTTTTEQYDWCDRNASTTKGLEGYILRNLINSTIEDVAKKEKIDQRVIQSALDRQVKKEVDWTKIQNLETVGMSSIFFALQKRYKKSGAVLSCIAIKDTIELSAHRSKGLWGLLLTTWSEHE